MYIVYNMATLNVHVARENRGGLLLKKDQLSDR